MKRSHLLAAAGLLLALMQAGFASTQPPPAPPQPTAKSTTNPAPTTAKPPPPPAPTTGRQATTPPPAPTTGSGPAKPAQPLSAPDKKAVLDTAQRNLETTGSPNNLGKSRAINVAPQSTPCATLTCRINKLKYPDLVIFAIGLVTLAIGFAGGVALGRWGRKTAKAEPAPQNDSGKLDERLSDVAIDAPPQVPLDDTARRFQSQLTSPDAAPPPMEEPVPESAAAAKAIAPVTDQPEPAVPEDVAPPSPQPVPPEPLAEIEPPVEPEPDYTPDEAKRLAEELMAAAGISRNDVETVLDELARAADGEAAAFAVINGLRAASVKKDAKPIAWLNHTAQLTTLLTACGYSERRAALLVPGFNADYDMATMHDYVRAATGSRSKVAKLIAPGLKLDGRVLVKASIESM
jgi:hypothetical protein